MDPFSVTVVAAIGGATGKLAEKACDSATKWLADRFKDHQPKAIAKARLNSEEFINDLVGRIQKLEEEARDDQTLKDKISSAFEDPDFSLLFHDALLGSARTDNSEKHKILSRIVAERLICPPEGLAVLASPLACNAVKYLTPNQMRFIGLSALIWFFRPTPFPPENIPEEKVGAYYVEWLSELISAIFPVEPLTKIEYAHLEAISLIVYKSLPYSNLHELLSIEHEAMIDWPYKDLVNKTDFGKQLLQLWGSGMNQISLTSVAILIGTYVMDELAGTSSITTW